MIRKQALLLFVVALFSMISVGCGGGVSEGVADGPEEPAPELTPDEIEGEMEATKSYNK